jgi:hypothetical protein
MRKFVLLSLVVAATLAAGGASLDHGGAPALANSAQSGQSRLVVFETFERTT